MTISRSILKSLQRLLPMEVSVHQKSIYVPKPLFAARGIWIEQTPYKETVYVRRLRLPFFRRTTFTPMNYSPRIPATVQSRTSDYFEGSPKIIADLIADAISRDNLHSDLTSLPEPDELLTIISGSNIDQSKIFILFDRACCTALLGLQDEAIQLFQEAEQKLRENISNWGSELSLEADLEDNLELASTLKQGRDITATLRRLCHANMRTLGFVPAPLPES